MKAAHKYQRHPSIFGLKENYKDLNFSFSSLSISNLQHELERLVSSKLVRETNISEKVMKENMDIFSPFLLNYFNNIIDSSSFPNHLKLTNITPVHNKYSQNDKRISRPVNVLSNTSKIFEIILNQQIYGHFENIFSKQKTGFRRGFNSQHCLLVMLEKFRKSLEEVCDYAALLTDQMCQKHLTAYLMI